MKKRLLLVLPFVIVLAAVFATSAFAVITPAGTQIRNRSAATYQDMIGNTFNAISNEVITVVLPVYGLSILPDDSGDGPPPRSPPWRRTPSAGRRCTTATPHQHRQRQRQLFAGAEPGRRQHDHDVGRQRRHHLQRRERKRCRQRRRARDQRRRCSGERRPGRLGHHGQHHRVVHRSGRRRERAGGLRRGARHVDHRRRADRHSQPPPDHRRQRRRHDGQPHRCTRYRAPREPDHVHLLGHERRHQRG